MTSVEGSRDDVKLADFIEQGMAQGQQASVAVKQAVLQQYVDDCAAQELGRRPREPKPSGLAQRRSSWRCSRCGSQRAADFNYGGHYERTLAFADGLGQLRIPRVRCRCGGNVPTAFGSGLPKRKRHWYDLDLTVMQWRVEGLSCRAVQRLLARWGCQVGLGSLARKVVAFATVDLNSGVAGARAQALSADAAFAGVGSGSVGHYYVHEVLGRERPLVRQEREVAWYRTGKVLACHWEAQETLAGWERVFGEVVGRGFCDPQEPLALVSDGNRGLLSAAELWLPWSVRQRCIWHIGHRVRERVSAEEHRERLSREAVWMLKGGDLEEVYGRCGKFVGRWLGREPEAVQWVAERFEGAVAHLAHPELEVFPRTVGISERYNQEVKRRFRAMRGFGDPVCLGALTRLLALRHNCLLDRIDWVSYAAHSVWGAPLREATTAQQQKAPPPPPYTKEGT